MDIDRRTADPQPQPPLPSFPFPESAGHQPSGEELLRARGTAFGVCVLAALVWVGVLTGVVWVSLGLPLDGYAFGVLLGSLLAPWLLSALITWLFLRRKRTTFWTPLIVSLPTFVILSLLFGAMNVAGQA